LGHHLYQWSVWHGVVMNVADNCDFYPAYPGFDYFAAGVHHGSAADFLTAPPPPPPGVVVSAGPHHVGPPSQQQPLADHVAPRELPPCSIRLSLHSLPAEQILYVCGACAVFTLLPVRRCCLWRRLWYMCELLPAGTYQRTTVAAHSVCCSGSHSHLLYVLLWWRCHAVFPALRYVSGLFVVRYWVFLFTDFDYWITLG